MSQTFSHSTYSPILLLLGAVVAASVVALLARSGFGSLAVTIALLSSAVLVLLAGEHVPVIALIAPRGLCFGDIGAPHLLAFILPIAATSLLLRRRAITRGG